MEDAAGRWSEHYGLEVERLSGWDGLNTWVAGGGYEAVVLMAPFVGPDTDAWRPVRETLRDAGIKIVECRRAWDQRLFPAARAGFFPFWHKVRPVVAKIGRL